MLKKCGIFPLTVALAIALSFSGKLFAAKQVSGSASVTVNMGEAHYQQIPDSASALGTLVAVQSTGLSFRTSGHLNQKLFKDGAVVQKGDVVAKLDDSTIASQLASAKANLDEAQSKYNRYELLKDSGVFSKQDYIGVATALKVAKASYASVLEQEQQLSLIAPFTGTLGKFNFSIGTQISTGTVIVNLVQLDPLKVNYSLSQSDKGKVKIGQAVLIHSDAWPGQEFKAKVSFISPTVNPNTGRFDIEALLSNPKDELSPGSLVHVEHILGKGSQALVVPQTAVSIDEDRSYVYVVKNGRAHQQTVSVGSPTDNGNIIITQGLKVGDSVVVNGVQKLSEDMPVRIISQSTPAKAPSTLNKSNKSSALPSQSTQATKPKQIKPSSSANTESSNHSQKLDTTHPLKAQQQDSITTDLENKSAGGQSQSVEQEGSNSTQTVKQPTKSKSLNSGMTTTPKTPINSQGQQQALPKSSLPSSDSTDNSVQNNKATVK